MRKAGSWLLIMVLTPAMLAAAPRPSPMENGPVALAAARALERLVRSSPSTPVATPTQSQTPAPGAKQNGNWIARHPALFGSLVGFAIGCPLGASQVGGSKDTFFNALDEFACPVIGGLGAAGGALIGWSIGRK